MDTIESFIADLIVKVLHKSIPAMTPDEDAKVQKTVADFVTAGSDLLGVYLALRSKLKS